MPVNRKTAATQKLQVLKDENVALKKKVRELEKERDGYLRMVHTWAKQKITPATLRAWDREDQDSGQTLLDVVREVKRERK
jgi:hypothetical protein